MPDKPRYSYADAGVSIEAGNDLVRAIAPLARATRRPGADADLGGFGGFFDPRAAGYKDPILVAATDGVGTKLRIAIDFGQHHGVGQDLVAMCVNDLIVQGAEPLFFLDYFATGKLNPGVARDVVAGIAAACSAAGCALIGGETAEMPGMYGAGDYDLAGFAVGAVERGQQLTGARIAAGDVLIGLASSGLHSNGFSLVRRIISGQGHAISAPAPFKPEVSLAQALLEPTRLYIKPLLPLLADGLLHGMAHITGGGLLENVPRVLPKGMAAQISAGYWALPPVFQWLATEGSLPPDELARTFNCGIGMVLVVAPDDAPVVLARLTDAGETAMSIGSITPGEDGERRCVISGQPGDFGAEAGWTAQHAL